VTAASGSSETIATLATPPGEGAVATILVRGPGALAAVARHFRSRSGAGLSRPMPGRALLGSFVARDSVLDEVVLAFAPPGAGDPLGAPDEIAIHGHGGAVAAGRLLDRLGASGVRVVPAGEYRERAAPDDPLRGRALEALLAARTRLAARMLLAQWRGALSARVRELRAQAREADAASAPDLGRALEALVARGRRGVALACGSRVLLAGAPNTGKSSLFNALLRTDRMIVSERPGTTRDAVDRWIELAGHPVRLFDTPGIAPFDDEVGRRAVAMARAALREASLVVFLVDGSRPSGDDDRAALEAIRGIERLVVRTKSDLPRPSGAAPGIPGLEEDVAVSVVTGSGLEALESALAARLGLDPDLDPSLPTPFAPQLVESLEEAGAACRELAGAPDGARAASERAHLLAALESVATGAKGAGSSRQPGAKFRSSGR